MLKSMTGYGRASAVLEDMEITVEVKSVNHRYFDFSARVPRTCGFLEEKLKSYIQTAISRGKVEAYVSINQLGTPDVVVELNRPLLESYLAAFAQMEKEYGVKNDITASALSGMNDLFAVSKQETDADIIWEKVRTVADQALADFIAMRSAEGAKMRADVLGRVEYIHEKSLDVDRRNSEIVNDYRARLETRIRELLADTQIEESRLLTEVAIFADKVAVAEETVRLRSHVEQMKQFLEAEEPIGRKMDFLVQEMNREVNTIGSKSNDIEVARMVVDLKSEIEKIREQIQNIE